MPLPAAGVGLLAVQADFFAVFQSDGVLGRAFATDLADHGGEQPGRFRHGIGGYGEAEQRFQRQGQQGLLPLFPVLVRVFLLLQTEAQGSAAVAVKKA